MKSALIALVLLAAAGTTLAEETFSELALHPAERLALDAAREGKFVRARELAESVLGSDPRSAVGELVLAMALHEGEGNVPLAVRHYGRARALLETSDGTARPGLERWHRELLHREAWALSDMGRYDDLLAINRRIRELYDPTYHSADVWPLMKLGRVEEARRAVTRALASGDSFEEVVARNGLCALDGYPACTEMLRAVRGWGLSPGLALRNVAVSAIEVGRYEEAERLLLESANHPSEETNPWRDLASLYAGQGRLGEASAAARAMIEFSRRLPARVRQHERAQGFVIAAEVLLLTGHADRALAAARRALAEPDRASHWSGSEEEINSEGWLLDRAIRRTAAERELEAARLSGVFAAPLHWWRALRHRVAAWLSGRKVLPLLLRGGLEEADELAHPEHPQVSAPPWLLIDAVDLLGPGPTLAHVARWRAVRGTSSSPVPRELREARATALETEAHWLAGDERRCLEAGGRARAALPAGEVLLRTRVAARMADAAWRSGQRARAWDLYAEVLERDPALLRRLGLALPVAPPPAGASLLEDAARRAARTPRFAVDRSSPFRIAAAGERLCLFGLHDAALACVAGEVPGAGDGPYAGDPVAGLADRLLRAAFAPRLELSQQDLTTLDGSAGAERELAPELLDLLSDPGSP
ncbi:MAG: hypothetical protein KBD01_18740 [Acidobacteria bacterium]|nr:hypothetical protein [Acidobacteriota bacterium]